MILSANTSGRVTEWSPPAGVKTVEPESMATWVAREATVREESLLEK
ncbi:MAG: hypothetical protein OXF02_01205 [Simkaniaceae bacterium]|nr:hypothetical protein [Simkaniaceae bacterium]